MGYISEDYCSEELSGMLMEKGYIGATNTYLDKDDINVKQITLQSAMKWLREVHRLFIFISPWIMFEDNIQYYFEIREIKTSDFETLYDYTSKELNSFEKVIEAAIKYCLKNLI